MGKLLAHGQAPYRHEPNQPLSYFMRLQTLETEQGARQRNLDVEQAARPLDGRGGSFVDSPHQGGTREFWSQDLKRAIRDSKSGVALGKVVAAKVVAREPVDNPRSSPARDGGVRYRNRWEVETPAFISRRARFARVVNENYQEARRDGVDGKEALGLYLIHAGARAVAAERYAHPDDREAFLQRVKNVVEASPERAALIAKAFERAKALAAAQRPAQPATPPPRTPDERAKEPVTRE